MVPHFIGSPSHWPPKSSVLNLIGTPVSTHAPPISLVPHLTGFINKSGVKRLNTLGHLDQYMAQHNRIVKQSYCETVWVTILFNYINPGYGL